MAKAYLVLDDFQGKETVWIDFVGLRKLEPRMGHEVRRIELKEEDNTLPISVLERLYADELYPKITEARP